MAAPGKQGSSRWGSFLSQAVAGVESRLDVMLGESEDGQAPTGTTRAPAAGAKPTPGALQAATSRPSPANSRSSSNNRTNDRLQARLAKAIAAKNAQGTSAAPTPRSSVDVSRRSSAERPSTEGERVDKGDAPTESTPAVGTADAVQIATPTIQTTPADGSDSAEATEDVIAEDTAPHNDVQIEETSQTSGQTPGAPSTSQKEALAQLALDMTEIKVRQEEEIQEYVERVDSLQAKLQYLSKNAAESAKKTGSSSPSGSVERRVAERDEKIALLMEEGQKLSISEQKFRTTIKKLRLQMGDHEKQMDELRNAKDKAIIDAETVRSRLNGNDEKEKRQEEARRATMTLQKEVDSLRKDRADQIETIRRIEQEAKTKAEQAESTHLLALEKAVTAERHKQKELEAIFKNLRAEQETVSQTARQERIEWKEKLDRAVERGQKVENELKVEIRATESKLEAMRSVAEEASSGSGGEAQIKMLRQIETLQSQYASASDNWHGIETSLLAKVANLEKERDEAQHRESEMRKKARDAASRSRRLEEDLQDLQASYGTAQQELETCRKQLDSLRVSVKTTETALENARTDLEKQQRAASREDAAEAERRQWVDEVAGATSKGQGGRPESPLLAVPRTFSSDWLGVSLQGRSKRGLAPGSIPDSPAEGLGLSLGRRFSSQPPARPSATSMTWSGPSPTPLTPFERPGDLARSPSFPVTERDDGADDADSSSPRNVAQDMISASTVAAGPSVQLVERMSAAIRRLEAEKMAAREEMARVCSQRDEARGDIATLMKDVETARASSERVSGLEGEVSSLNARYQTTLEMLGEKSERVEELQADVEDVKTMYRELVERTVK